MSDLMKEKKDSSSVERAPRVEEGSITSNRSLQDNEDYDTVEDQRLLRKLDGRFVGPFLSGYYPCLYCLLPLQTTSDTYLLVSTKLLRQVGESLSFSVGVVCSF